jgi:hypothetical protein
MLRHIKQRTLSIYVSVGIVLALLRVSTLIYVNHRMATHTMTDAVRRLSSILYPESILVSVLPFAILESQIL